MKRLTYRDANGEAWYSDVMTERDRLHRLASIEDILGDEYDLDRLRELAWRGTGANQEDSEMKEYIERAAVKDEILSWAVCINHPELLSKEDTMYCIDSIPAADVVEVRHAHWKMVQNGKGICGACNRLDSIDQLATHCRYCGARMDKED